MSKMELSSEDVKQLIGQQVIDIYALTKENAELARQLREAAAELTKAKLGEGGKKGGG